MEKTPNIALFLNSSAKIFPFVDISRYDAVFATDGAYDKFKDIIEFSAVIGDFDSLKIKPHDLLVIHTPDSRYTDFEKALMYLDEQSYKNIDVYNGSGGEQDHFLGNLNAAFKFHEKLNICFYDEKQCYFYVDSDIALSAQIGQIISLFPFPQAVVTSKGLKYEMGHYSLDMRKNIGIRNQAEQQDISITCHSGGYFLFLEKGKAAFRAIL